MSSQSLWMRQKIFQCLTELYIFKKDFKNAMLHLTIERDSILNSQIPNPSNLAFCLNSMAIVSAEQGNNEAALGYCNQALEVLGKLGGDKEAKRGEMLINKSEYL